jgi:hypothetical protein
VSTGLSSDELDGKTIGADASALLDGSRPHEDEPVADDHYTCAASLIARAGHGWQAVQLSV